MGRNKSKEVKDPYTGNLVTLIQQMERYTMFMYWKN